jgi:hypothetical protein
LMLGRSKTRRVVLRGSCVDARLQFGQAVCHA